MLVRFLFFLFIVAFVLVIMLLLRDPGFAYKTLPIPIEKSPKMGKFDQWREFHSVIGNFKVSMPGQPQHAIEKLPIPNTELFVNYNMYVAEEGDGTTVMVSLIRYPKEVDTSNREAMLENVMNEMVSSDPGNQLRSMKFSKFQDQLTLDFRIENKNILILNKALMVKQDLYLLTLIDKTGNFQELEFSHFINSFKLLER